MLLNKSRALEYMRECGLDGIVASSPVNAGYFTGYFCWLDGIFKEYMWRPGGSGDLPETYAILTADGELTLLLNSLFVANALHLQGIEIRPFGNSGLDFSQGSETRETESPFRDLVASLQQCPSAHETLVDVMSAKGLASGRIGFEMAGVPTERVREITQTLPNASIRDCSNLIRLIRAVKTPDEVALLARSAEISEKAAVSALELAGSGVEMQQLFHQFQLVVASEGAEHDHFAFSPYGMGISLAPDYKLKGDEIMYFDFGCKFAHYFSDSGTTLALTALPDSLEKRYAALQACMEAGSVKLAPGIRASEVQKAMALECEARNVQACFPHGHGLGLEVRDYPILVPSTGLPIRDDCLNTSSDLPLEDGMVTNLEACVFVPGVGSVHVERSFVVTATGNRPLTQQARDKPHRNT